MTDYLDEIQARADAATAAAPTGAGWVAVWSEDLDHYTIYTDDDAFKDVCVITPDIPQVAHFIAHARTDVPRLVAALRAVEAFVTPYRSRADGWSPEAALARMIDTAIRDTLGAR